MERIEDDWKDNGFMYIGAIPKKAGGRSVISTSWSFQCPGGLLTLVRLKPLKPCDEECHRL